MCPSTSQTSLFQLPYGYISLPPAHWSIVLLRQDPTNRKWWEWGLGLCWDTVKLWREREHGWLSDKSLVRLWLNHFLLLLGGWIQPTNPIRTQAHELGQWCSAFIVMSQRTWPFYMGLGLLCPWDWRGSASQKKDTQTTSDQVWLITVSCVLCKQCEEYKRQPPPLTSGPPPLLYVSNIHRESQTYRHIEIVSVPKRDVSINLGNKKSRKCSTAQTPVQVFVLKYFHTYWKAVLSFIKT